MVRKIAVFLLFAAAATTLLHGEDFWVKKQYKDWSKEECKRLLTNSPWAQRSDLAQVNMVRVADATAMPSLADVTSQTPSGAGSDRTSTQINYVVQIRSALPVRQAWVQQQMLAAVAASLPADQQKEMSQRADAVLGMKYSDVILVHVIYGSNNAQVDRVLASFWQHQTLDQLKLTATLIVRGKRIAPVNFQVVEGAGREFALIFPRIVDGAPVVTADDKLFAVEFRSPGLGGSPGGTASSRRGGSQANSAGAMEATEIAPEKIYVPFRPKDMVIKGELVY